MMWKLCNERDRNIEIKGIEPALQTKVTILIVDRSYSFVAELNDDTQSDSEGAVGFGQLINSKSTGTILTIYIRNSLATERIGQTTPRSIPRTNYAG